MRTVKKLEEYFKKHKMNHLDDGGEYDSGESRFFKYNIGGKKKRVHYSWGSSNYRWTGGTTIGGYVGNAPYCCGVFELGGFEGGTTRLKHWEAILEYIIQVKKLSYLRTETITKPKTTQMVEKALENVGFRLVTTIKSAHAARESDDPKDQYDIKVWEWLKPE